MRDNESFDRSGMRFIHRCGICLLLLGLGGGCDQNSTRTPPIQPPDAGAVLAAAADGGQAEVARPLDQTGLFGEGDQQVAQAVGRAPRGVDRGLSRDRAEARARGNLLRLLKESGTLSTDENTLAGARIARVWSDDKYSYALAILPIKNIENPLNESQAAPSNPSEQQQPAPASPKGGTVP